MSIYVVKSMFVKIGDYPGVTTDYCGYTYGVQQITLKPQLRCFNHDVKDIQIVDSFGVKYFKPNLSTDYRIYGGRNVEPGESPWTVFIKYDNLFNTNLFSFCTGSIINKRWIITAAHCNSGTGNKPVYPRIRVFVGNGEHREDRTIHLVSIDKIYRHPSFKKINSDNTILHYIS
ncbi:chymotrypsin-like protease CTRL-1 [Oppia nitens]|uniref:chymotrypsin-like protease CTRL-1 n=1 Tax=Oppia nitens TaxID=1686743 RepID=UPI0023DBF3F1|nr:chymotrypsin-like protease CTRL-1 [Oppia nitens]